MFSQTDWGKPVAVIILTMVITTFASAQVRSHSIGRKVDDFSILNAKTSRPWRLSEDGGDAKAIALYFNTTECPVTNRYLPKLKSIQKNYRDKKVLIVAINSNAHDSLNEIKKHLKEYEIDFTVLQDDGGKLARRLKVNRTSEVFLLDHQRKIRYRGAIDDRFERGVTKPKVNHDYFINALDNLLKGKSIKHTTTDVTACPLELPDTESADKPVAKVTFSEHIATIMQARCQSCHRPKGIGPFELLTFKDAYSWRTSIREVITQDIMPPWHAESKHGHFFANDRSLTDIEYRTLLDWIDGGALEGDPSKMPKSRSFPDSWTIGSPDLVVSMDKEIDVPAETPELGVPYKYVWAGKPFEKETWVKSAEVRPGASEVVHHATAYIVPEGVKLEFKNDERPGGAQTEFTSPINNLPFLVAFVPGDNAFKLGDGLAKRIPKGARILFEMHYTPNGKKQRDRTELGLVFADQPPKNEVLSGGTLNYWFSIPPGANAHPVVARSEKFKRDSVLLSMNPHMHYRGRSFRYELLQPSGKRKLLLDVPRYSFDWQSTYWLSKPIKVPKGSRIVCTATFDNSKENPFNPDPTARVTWGEQTWQEMMLASWEYYEKK